MGKLENNRLLIADTFPISNYHSQLSTYPFLVQTGFYIYSQIRNRIDRVLSSTRFYVEIKSTNQTPKKTLSSVLCCLYQAISGSSSSASFLVDPGLEGVVPKNYLLLLFGNFSQHGGYSQFPKLL